MAALGARVTAGSADRGAAPLDRTATYAYYQHEVLRFLEVVALVGAPPVELEPRLAVTAADLAAADADLAAADADLAAADAVLAGTELVGAAGGGVRSGPWVALHPGAGDARRRWPAASFAVVADRLAAAVGTATVGIYWCGNVITAGPLTRARHRIGVSFRVDCPVCGAAQSHGRCPHDPSFVADVPPGEIVEHALELYTDAAGRDEPTMPSEGRGEGRW